MMYFVIGGVAILLVGGGLAWWIGRNRSMSTIQKLVAETVARAETDVDKAEAEAAARNHVVSELAKLRVKTKTDEALDDARNSNGDLADLLHAHGLGDPNKPPN